MSKPKTDKEVIDLVVNYLAQNKNASRAELKRKLHVDTPRLVRLEKEGHYKLPKPLSLSQCATIRRKMRGNGFDNWQIKANKPYPAGYVPRKS
ncbi:MAG: hypothetical protein RLZZ469_1663 [Bacteroidota bacterium]|jgi:hypothetical protein